NSEGFLFSGHGRLIFRPRAAYFPATGGAAPCAGIAIGLCAIRRTSLEPHGSRAAAPVAPAGAHRNKGAPRWRWPEGVQRRTACSGGSRSRPRRHETARAERRRRIAEIWNAPGGPAARGRGLRRPGGFVLGGVAE